MTLWKRDMEILLFYICALIKYQLFSLQSQSSPDQELFFSFLEQHKSIIQAVVIKTIPHLSDPILCGIWLLIQPVILVGAKQKKLSLAKYHQVLWQGRVLNSQFGTEELRNQGCCPLTPGEVGLLLAALGFNNSTRFCLASHKVYGGEARISTWKLLFPFY